MMKTATETLTPKMAHHINLEMFGLPNIESWFTTCLASGRMSPQDLAAGIASDAQAFMSVGDMVGANQRLNRVKWIIQNKL